MSTGVRKETAASLPLVSGDRVLLALIVFGSMNLLWVLVLWLLFCGGCVFVHPVGL